MIRYTLRCDKEDEFEAWFRNSADYDSQAASGLIACPFCNSVKIEKAPMAPNVISTKGRDEPNPRAIAMAMAAKMREHIRDNFDYVGDRFKDEARKILDGDADDRPIWGEATAEDARAMMEEGLPVAPLPEEIAPTPPRKLN